MTKRQWGFTPANPVYPPYLNVSELDDGNFRVTVRSPIKEDGSCGDSAAITLSADDFNLYIASLRQSPEPVMTEAQIKHMVDRFLGWKLPEDFSPDGGISFQPLGNAGTPYEYKFNPSGTNLFDATQADSMVRYLIEGLSGVTPN